MKSRIRPHLALVAVTLIFGLHYSIAKSMMPGYLSPAQLIFLRILGGVILFWAFQGLFVKEKVEKRDLIKLAVCAIFGFALNQTLFYEGLNMTSPVDAALIHVLNPILVMIAAHFLIGETINRYKVTGIILGAGGALILILYRRTVDFGSNHTLGNLFVFLNMVFYAMYLVIIKPLAVKYHSATILKWVSLFGFLFVLPYTIKPAFHIPFSGIDLQGYLSLTYIILMNTFLAYLLINYALKFLTTGTVSYYNYLQPFIAAIMTVSTGQDMLSWPKVVAGLMIFAGVFIVNKSATGNSNMPRG
jgi:drug/metabolite transporter (DMT)-like permease